MDARTNRSYHRPVWDDNGRIYYELVSRAKEKNHVAVCLIPPEKMIPVIFIPGVMGSNLKNEDGEVWQFSASSLKKWPLANAKKRKRLLDPETTTVDDSGEIFNDGADGKYHPQTWLFYSAGAGNPSDAFLTWKERIPLRVKEAQRFRKDAGDPVDLSPLRTFELLSSGSPGDGTVPVTAIRASSPCIHGVLATDVDHEGAYAVDPVDRSRSVYSDLSDALLFTVRSVVKIVQQVPAP